jgi:type I restriction enzyme R subunit
MASIGGMVICDSSEQAKQMFEIFNAKYAKGPMPAVEQVNDNDLPYSKAAQPESAY